jgi:hypothetical protein
LFMIASSRHSLNILLPFLNYSLQFLGSVRTFPVVSLYLHFLFCFAATFRRFRDASFITALFRGKEYQNPCLTYNFTFIVKLTLCCIIFLFLLTSI